MTVIQAFFLGVMVVLTPSMLVLALLLRRELGADRPPLPGVDALCGSDAFH